MQDETETETQDTELTDLSSNKEISSISNQNIENNGSQFRYAKQFGSPNSFTSVNQMNTENSDLTENHDPDEDEKKDEYDDLEIVIYDGDYFEEKTLPNSPTGSFPFEFTCDGYQRKLYDDLIAYTFQNSMDTNLPFETTLKIPKGTVLSQLDFQPNGDDSPNPSKMTDYMLRGLETLDDFLNVHSRNHLDPDFLYGKTNITMARIAERIGFSMVLFDETTEKLIPYDPSIDTDNNQKLYVFGKAEKVREKIKELKESKAYEKLVKRAKRETAKKEITDIENTSVGSILQPS